MSRAEAERDLEARARLFKALGHPGRLLILNLISTKPRCGDELAAILSLKPATVSFHLSLLEEAGWLVSRKDQYYRVFSLKGDRVDRTVRELAFLPQPELGAHLEVDAYRAKVLRSFMKHGRLVKFPAQLKKQQVILEHLVEAFERDQKYTELEVNQVLVEFNDDVATLRRGMIEHDLLRRERSVYWRPG